MKTFFRAIIFLILINCFCFCGNDRNKKDSRTVFRYNESSGISTLDPAFAKDQAHIWVCNQLYNGLVQPDDSMHIKPCIAKSWEVSDDGLTYTFILRKDVFFHDDVVFSSGKGRRVMAEDFVYSFSRIADDNVASPGSWIFNDVSRDSSGKCMFLAYNDTTFVVKLQEPFPPFLSLLQMQYCSVIPREVVDYYGKDFRSHAVGTGPFRLKMWKENQRLILIKNGNYFEIESGQRLPYLDAVSISFIADKQSAFLEFVRGNLDFMSGVAPSYIDELISKNGNLSGKYKDKINLTLQPYLNTEYLGFMVDENLSENKNNPLLKKEVRQAINYGFDRKKMIKYLRNSIGTPGIYGIVPVGIPYYDTSLYKRYTYNPDKARELLAIAGYPHGKGLPEITLSATASYRDLCEYIQHQLDEIGIKIKVDENQPAMLREMIAKSKVSFFRASWIADYPDMENYLSLFYSPNFCPKGPNYTHFSNKKFDSLFEKARTINNDSIRTRLYAEMDNIIIEEAPVVVLYYDMVLRFTQKNISGLGSNPMNLLILKRVKKTKTM
ncbi:MAG: ABC transporter substrate-binding protein [Bacteroidales bacterium]|nr:ABC transporter substrate-binding protein [Bacteroidales bacterium]MDD4213508.1 ABC transporter substrate-binding protein [Bacteroidales bacterium]